MALSYRIQVASVSVKKAEIPGRILILSFKNAGAKTLWLCSRDNQCQHNHCNQSEAWFLHQHSRAIAQALPKSLHDPPVTPEAVVKTSMSSSFFYSQPFCCWEMPGSPDLQVDLSEENKIDEPALFLTHPVHDRDWSLALFGHYSRFAARGHTRAWRTLKLTVCAWSIGHFVSRQAGARRIGAGGAVGISQ